jgi:hypothetical protein
MPDPKTGGSNPGADENRQISDEALVERIDELVEEEHRLEREHAGAELGDADRDRLRHLEVQLDQAWDLLRRRRARRNAGLDPDLEAARPEDVVENYQQ